jgi:hypothetical protein
MHVAEYTWRLEKGHPVVSLGGKPYLLSTGSKRSVANGPILLERRDIDPCPSHQGVTVASLRKRIGSELAGMLGCDLLSPFTINVYPEEHLMRFSEGEVQGDIAMPLSIVKGVPVIRAQVAGRELPLLLDTASAISLLPESMVLNSELQGRNQTFHPRAGSFLTQYYTCEICVGGERRLFRVGILPEPLDAELSQEGIEGVLGVDLLEHFGLCLNISEKILKLGQRSLAAPRRTQRPPVARQAMQ